MSQTKKVCKRTIPLCGIVLVLGSVGCGRVSFYSFTASPAAYAENDNAPAKQELIGLIEAFLKDVPNNDRATFDRFFADDVLYTRGSGILITKKDILADTGKTTVPRANATFNGEDFTVHQYGDTAVVNFRLIVHAVENEKPVTRSFRNTGTFMKGNGRWQAIAWQATPIQEK